MMAGFYIQHNTSIGLRCFAWGILFGLGSLYQLFYNALVLRDAVWLHGDQAARRRISITFVTAHSSFELTAIIVSGAAGLRLGWGLIDTQGQSRVSSLRREAANALPAVGAAVVLFVLAAFVEGYVSASSLPYWAKAAVAIVERGRHHRLLDARRSRDGTEPTIVPPATRSARMRPATSGDLMIAARSSYRMEQVKPFRYRPSCSAVALRPAGCLQDRRDLERRLEPRAEELWSGL